MGRRWMTKHKPTIAMAFTFPEFSEPVAIDAQRSWTATFDSYDQRNDDVYYVVTLREVSGATMNLMVRVGLDWAGDDWTGLELLDRLRKEIHGVAATGKSNTHYTGAMLRPSR